MREFAIGQPVLRARTFLSVPLNSCHAVMAVAAAVGIAAHVASPKNASTVEQTVPKSRRVCVVVRKR